MYFVSRMVDADGFHFKQQGYLLPDACGHGTQLGGWSTVFAGSWFSVIRCLEWNFDSAFKRLAKLKESFSTVEYCKFYTTG